MSDPEGNGQKPITVTPKQLLVIVLKVVFKDRTTDEGIEKICSVTSRLLRIYGASRLLVQKSRLN